MDKIQKILIKAGREDLAQKYFNRLQKKAMLPKNIQDIIKNVENLNVADDEQQEIVTNYLEKNVKKLYEWDVTIIYHLENSDDKKILQWFAGDYLSIPPEQWLIQVEYEFFTNNNLATVLHNSTALYDDNSLPEKIEKLEKKFGVDALNKAAISLLSLKGFNSTPKLLKALNKELES